MTSEQASFPGSQGGMLAARLDSPVDETVAIGHATGIFVNAKHPKSFVSLADADHLLRRRSDAVFAASIIAVWSERYLD